MGSTSIVLAAPRIKHGCCKAVSACWQPLAITVVLTGNMCVSGIDIVCDVGSEIIVFCECY